MKLEYILPTVVFLILAYYRYGEIKKRSKAAVFEIDSRGNRFSNA